MSALKRYQIMSGSDESGAEYQTGPALASEMIDGKFQQCTYDDPDVAITKLKEFGEKYWIRDTLTSRDYHLEIGWISE